MADPTKTQLALIDALYAVNMMLAENDGLPLALEKYGLDHAAVHSALMHVHDFERADPAFLFELGILTGMVVERQRGLDEDFSG